MLKTRGFRNVSPFAVLQVLHGKQFPPHMFHVGWFEDLWENRQRYADLASRLGDDASREVLDAVLGYRQTLVPETLADIVRPHDSYVPNDLFVLREDEIYIDGGAFDGDTTGLFIERADGRFARVFCFEPDPATYPRLAANFAGEPRVVPVNAGLWSKADTLRFHNDAGRASLLDNSGGIEVKVVALDDVLNGERASIVKMNIEGAELDALRGAASTIRRYRPRLAIAAYHRPSDLWQIAGVIEEIAPGYEFYLRQHNGGVIETVLYAAQSQTSAD
jgi:FkbM family methyltransferase